MDKKEVFDFALFCDMLFQKGEYIVLLVDSFTIDEWTLAFNKYGFVVMPYLYAFMYQTDSVPKRYVSGFPKNVALYEVVARLPGLHPDGVSPQFQSRLTGSDCLSSKGNAVISSVLWPTMKLII